MVHSGSPFFALNSVELLQEIVRTNLVQKGICERGFENAAMRFSASLWPVFFLNNVRLCKYIEDLVIAGIRETPAFCGFFDKCKNGQIHVDTRNKSEHLLHLCLQ